MEQGRITPSVSYAIDPSPSDPVSSVKTLAQASGSCRKYGRQLVTYAFGDRRNPLDGASKYSMYCPVTSVQA